MVYNLGILLIIFVEIYRRTLIFTYDTSNIDNWDKIVLSLKHCLKF